MKVILFALVGLAVAMPMFPEQMYPETVEPAGWPQRAPYDTDAAPVNGDDTMYTPANVPDMAGQAEDISAADATAGGVKSFSLSVGDITSAIAAGGSNPIEALILAKVSEGLTATGMTIRAGSLVWERLSNPEIKLASGCSVTASLASGWSANAVLKPATSVSLNYGFDKTSLFVHSSIFLDTAFGMKGRVNAKVGKKLPIIGCVRISKGIGIGVGGDLALNVRAGLVLHPSLRIDEQGVGITIRPQGYIDGELVRFEPRAEASFKIFGIPLSGVQRAIRTALVNTMNTMINPQAFRDSMHKLNLGLQAAVNEAFANFRINLINFDPAMIAQVQAAIAHLESAQVPALQTPLPGETPADPVEPCTAARCGGSGGGSFDPFNPNVNLH